MELETIKHIKPAFVDARGEIINVFEGNRVMWPISLPGKVRCVRTIIIKKISSTCI